MEGDLHELPDDPAVLKAMIADMRRSNTSLEAEVAVLKTASADAQARMATMHAEMARQGDAMRTQISDEVKAAASNPKCVTVTNGTNTSVSCP